MVPTSLSAELRAAVFQLGQGREVALVIHGLVADYELLKGPTDFKRAEYSETFSN